MSRGLNRIETFFSEKLRRFEIIRSAVKYLYQKIWTIFSKSKLEFSGVSIWVLKDCFGGFHNVKVFNGEDVVCALRHHKPRSEIEIGAELEVIVSRPPYSDQITVGSTAAFNWQQGCRLQFYSENNIIFNVIEDGFVKAKTVCINTFEHSYLDYSIYAVGPLGSNLLATCSFLNIETNMTGYGYRGEYRERVGTNQISIFNSQSEIFNHIYLTLDLREFITHLEFSRDGHYISFFRRSKISRNNYYTKLCVYQIDGTLLVDIKQFEYITHYAWTDEGIMFFAKERKKEKGGYYFYHIRNGMVSMVSNIFPDGHPTYSNGRLLTDTYPDRRRIQKLKAINNLEGMSGDCCSIVEATIPPVYIGNNRVDFHPRLNLKGNLFSIDVAREHGVDMFIGKLDE
jgi:hypothetical protein